MHIALFEKKRVFKISCGKALRRRVGGRRVSTRTEHGVYAARLLGREIAFTRKMLLSGVICTQNSGHIGIMFKLNTRMFAYIA